MLLVLWDVDGTLVHTGGHGRYAFEEAYEIVIGRPFAQRVSYAGRTDHQIALSMLEGEREHLPRVLSERRRRSTGGVRRSPPRAAPTRACPRPWPRCTSART